METKMKLSNAKGTQDFPPEKQILRNEIVGKLTGVFELYGFNPLDTPILERLETLTSKYAGGAEILKETFRLKDQGKRDLGLRYDLTVPLARFVGMNPNLKLPFKRYQIGRAFRDGPIKPGRYREFVQCDVDIVGVSNMAADAEIVSLAQAAFGALGYDAIIKVNNRKVLNGLLEAAGVNKEKFETVILSIDKLEKLGQEAVRKELGEKGLSKLQIGRLMASINLKGSNASKIKKLSALVKSDEGKEGLSEINELLTYLDKKNVEFDVSLARGLAYYTGTVFEAFLKGSDIKSSVAGGGRYDNMIGQLLGGPNKYPAVGISFGLDAITDAVGETEKRKSVVTAYVIPIGAQKESMRIAQQLRNSGIKTDIDLSGKGVSKNLDYANALGIPYVIFVGKTELSQKKVKLRDMKTGKETLQSLEKIMKILKVKQTP